MSRTYKDKPNKFRKDHYSWHEDWERVTYTYTYRNILKDGEPVTYTSSYSVQKPTSKRKKRKELDTEDHWMTTPSWWWRIVHHRPTRRACHIWEKSVHRFLDDDVDLSICPDFGRKPHHYFW